MSGHIILNGVNINYIIDSIDVKYGLNHSTSPYIGQLGSTTSFISMNSRVITCKSICTNTETDNNGNPRIGAYISLAGEFAQTPTVLTSQSTSNSDGNYIITGFDYVEDTTGNYEISWEFTEVEQYNVTSKTFRVWNKSKKGGKKTAKKHLSSTYKNLLKKDTKK